MAKKPDERLMQALADDDAFDALLQASLAPVDPPCDLSDRVMRAVAQEPAPELPAKVLRFPFRRFALGAAASAAALLLFVAVAAPPADQPGVLTTKPLQLAAEPLLNMTFPVQPAETTPAPAEQTAPAQAAEPAQPDNEPANDAPAAPAEPQAVSHEGELILPRAAFGTETEGSIEARLVAEVAGSRIYQPGFADDYAVFYTADDVNVYSWRANLKNPSEPQTSVQMAQNELTDMAALSSTVYQPVNANTVVTSPDQTMLAQNSRDGLWVSLLDGDVFHLTDEGGGNILAWAPDSSRLLFTNAEGQLFLGYPLEQRIYKITSQSVKDVCWSSDNKTLLYVVAGENEDALYTVRAY